LFPSLAGRTVRIQYDEINAIRSARHRQPEPKKSPTESSIGDHFSPATRVHHETHLVPAADS
jgi:hypothetical protein